MSPPSSPAVQRTGGKKKKKQGNAKPYAGSDSIRFRVPFRLFSTNFPRKLIQPATSRESFAWISTNRRDSRDCHFRRTICSIWRSKIRWPNRRPSIPTARALCCTEDCNCSSSNFRARSTRRNSLAIHHVFYDKLLRTLRVASRHAPLFLLRLTVKFSSEDIFFFVLALDV